MSDDKLQQTVLAFEEESKELALSLHREQKRNTRLQNAIDSIAKKIVSKFPNDAVQSLSLEDILQFLERMTVIETVETPEVEEPPKKGTKS